MCSRSEGQKDTANHLGWSIRLGEFAHNLRSALDQLVRQLAAAHGSCAGECPGRHSELPIRVGRDQGRLDVRLCGVDPAARAYIESVQPPPRPGRRNAVKGNRVGRGLACSGTSATGTSIRRR